MRRLSRAPVLLTFVTEEEGDSREVSSLIKRGALRSKGVRRSWFQLLVFFRICIFAMLTLIQASLFLFETDTQRRDFVNDL